MLSPKKSMLALCSLSVAVSFCIQTAGLARSLEPIPLQFQNAEMKSIVGEDRNNAQAVTKEMLDKVIRELESHGTLALRRYSSGGHSAVTVHEPRSLESAIDGMLIMHWDRDNILQALAEYQLRSEDDEMRINLKVPKDAWRQGLLASLKHHYNYHFRFTDIIEGKVGAHDFSKRPHIRYNPVSLQEVQDPWGHAQNDALGYILFLTFYSANQGNLNIAHKAQKEANQFGVLLPLFFEKIEVWKDIDFGGWEDKKAEHASSIACALAGLKEEKKYVDRHGSLSEKIDGKDYTVTSELLGMLIKKCDERLAKILPNEFIISDAEDKRADASRERKADSALINALFLGALSGDPVVSEKMTEQILSSTIIELCRPIGFARYEHDIWDGRTDRKDLRNREEAQWSHVAPMISVVYGDLYRRTKKEEYFRLQDLFFRRSLTTVNSRWRIPEAYIVNAKTRKWVSDANEPLAWAQSAEIMAIIAMKRSLAEHNSVKPAGTDAKAPSTK